MIAKRHKFEEDKLRDAVIISEWEYHKDRSYTREKEKMKVYTTTRIEDITEIRDMIDNLIDRIERGWDSEERK